MANKLYTREEIEKSPRILDVSRATFLVGDTSEIVEGLVARTKQENFYFAPTDGKWKLVNTASNQ